MALVIEVVRGEFLPGMRDAGHGALESHVAAFRGVLYDFGDGFYD